MAYIAFLDIKSAFDVVSHASLLRKLYDIGIEGQCWSLIHQLHQGARSSVKCGGAISTSFYIEQGMRQGGLLSTDLFKVYNNPLLCKVSDSGYGAKIGNIRCGAPTVADDTAFMSDSKTELQIMLDMAVDNSKREVYLLQPVKHVVLEAKPSRVKIITDVDLVCTLDGEYMPIVDHTAHIGMYRSATLQTPVAIDSNIQKSRRAMYRLMPAGLHGRNGLDPPVCDPCLQN